jgi:hypothetical protein
VLPHWHSYTRIFLPLAESSMAPMNFGSLPHLPQRGGDSGLMSTAAFSIFLILAPTQPGRHESPGTYRVIAQRSARHQTEEPLVGLILRGVRQRAFVILNPYVIPRIDPAVARLASEIMLGLGDAPPVGALAQHRAARSRFIE